MLVIHTMHSPIYRSNIVIFSPTLTDWQFPAALNSRVQKAQNVRTLGEIITALQRQCQKLQIVVATMDAQSSDEFPNGPVTMMTKVYYRIPERCWLELLNDDREAAWHAIQHLVAKCEVLVLWNGPLCPHCRNFEHNECRHLVRMLHQRLRHPHSVKNSLPHGHSPLDPPLRSKRNQLFTASSKCAPPRLHQS